MRATVGFVPTMGALHDGHATLVRKSSKDNSITVVSIFVNPKQFGPQEDFAKYPRTFEADCALCEKAGAQIVFAPTADELYPADFKTQVNVSEMSDVLCGAYRPDHFAGVCTVVLLLLNCVSADRAYFGLKDFQQFTIIARMAADLDHPTCIMGVPTVRDGDGFALSSRNRYLDDGARKSALCIPRALRAAGHCFLDGNSDSQTVLAAALEILSSESGFELQYCEIRNAKNLSLCNDKITQDSVLAIAGFVQGGDGVRTRLIDNIVLTHEPDRLETLLDFVRQGANQQ
ncbi:MAG: hypothetical protein RL189_1260 [Pseudomonadota bacterium]